MRIIGGQARGRTLIAPPGKKTRPTQDYVRESLFNILQFEITDARVLDLFAGTGALSLEAVSRGASKAVMVEIDRAACDAICRNIQNVKMPDRCSLIAGDYRRAIDMLAKAGATFDIVFIDPPYRMENTGEMCDLLLKKGLLSNTCLLVVEHRRGNPPQLDRQLEAYDLRKYGDTEITFIRLKERGSDI